MERTQASLSAVRAPSGRWQQVTRYLWITWFGPVLLTIWIVVGVFLMFRRYEAFWTTTYDQALYSQVIWNTGYGRWFASSLFPKGHLADHFSPALAVLAPFMRVFPDGRVLALVKVLALGVAVMPAYAIVRRRYPALAPFLIVAFVLNPAMNAAVMDTGDFHGLHLAPPALALMLYAWHRERRLLVLLSAALALLVREDTGIYVASFGLYLLLFQPRWRRLGAGIATAAALWTVLVITVLIPEAAKGQHTYTYLSEASRLEPAWRAVLAGRMPALTEITQLFFTREKIEMVWRLLAPLGLLPLWGNGAQLLWAPGVLYQVAVTAVGGGLGGHFLAPLFPLWWAAAALALAGLTTRWAKGGVALLLGATLVGAWQLGLHGPANPLEWQRLAALTPHDRLGPAALTHVPPGVAVVAQNGLGPHLAFREKFEMFPWYKPNPRPKLIVLDAKSDNIYPYLTGGELVKGIQLLQMDPTLRLAYELDGYYILGLEVDPQIPRQGPWQWLPYLELEGYELAQSDEGQAIQAAPFTPTGGRTLRVELYWTARAPMTEDYKISVLLKAPDGFILAQDDSYPGQNSLRTRDWATGRTIRDLHYLGLPEGELPSPLSLAVVVYEANTLKRLPPEEDVTITTLP